MEAEKKVIIVRFSGELSIKPDAEKYQAIERLCKQISLRLSEKNVFIAITHFHDRFQIKVSEQEVQSVCAVLDRSFGVGNYSLVDFQCSSKEEQILRLVPNYQDQFSGAEFRVRVKRSGQHSYSSMDLEKKAGAILGKTAKVNLSFPQKVLHIEVINEEAFLYSEKRKGPGGLPPHKRERALVLMSGGFDSAVAAWMLMKRGVCVDYLFCNMGGKSTERQTLQIAKVLSDLWNPDPIAKFISLDFTDSIEDIKKHSSLTYRQILLKCKMYEAASNVSKILGCYAIVTGEALGQVSSQSLQNLRAIDLSTRVSVLRPCIGMDKQEIIKKAYEIGTGVLSAKVLELCGITQGKAVRKANPSKTDEYLQSLDQSLIEKAIQERTEILLKDVDGKMLQSEYLFVDEISEGYEVIDCRTQKEFSQWHYAGARNLSLRELLANLKSLNKKKKYVLYCSFGTQTPVAAEIMQQSGFQAYAFKGGIGKLRSLQK